MVKSFSLVVLLSWTYWAFLQEWKTHLLDFLNNNQKNSISFIIFIKETLTNSNNKMLVFHQSISSSYEFARIGFSNFQHRHSFTQPTFSRGTNITGTHPSWALCIRNTGPLRVTTLFYVYLLVTLSPPRPQHLCHQLIYTITVALVCYLPQNPCPSVRLELKRVHKSGLNSSPTKSLYD